MGGLLLWKIIGCGVLIFFGIGIVYSILTTIVTILSPFIIILFFILSVVTYPITVLLRSAGYNCRSLYEVGIAWWNGSVRPTSNYRADSKNNYYDNSSSQREDSEPKQSPPSFDPWEVLGVDPGIPEEEVKVAYRRKLMTNHPDKVATLDPEIQRFATKRTRLIKAAYEQIVDS